MVGTLPVEHWNLGIGPINCHAWNKDRTQLAVSASSNEIYIFQWSGQWKQIHVLAEHDLPITGIDWAPNTNRIVSCSQDKNAFVWTFENGAWKPALVLVRISKAATSVKWAPLENKFAVGSGSKLVSVCYYERDNDWWVAKHIKKPIRSTVTCIDWHPNNVLLAVGACDFKARVYSAYVKEVDDRPGPNPWGTRLPFGNLLAELPSLGWVHNVSFSPSGLRLAWVSHDSSISMVDANVNIDDISNVRTKHLPFNAVKWVSENSVVAAGHDCSPMLFNIVNNKLQFACKLDIPSENKTSSVNSAFQKFRNFDRNAVNETVNVQLKTLHQNAITQILTHSGRSDNVQKFTTCGIDGLIALWDLKNNTAVVH